MYKYKIIHNGSGEVVDKNGYIAIDKRFQEDYTEFEDYTETSRFISENLNGIVSDEVEEDGFVCYTIKKEKVFKFNPYDYQGNIEIVVLHNDYNKDDVVECKYK